MGLSFPEQVIYAEEIERARVPAAPGTGVPIAGPTIIRHGSEEQRTRWLRPLLRADEIWAQAWSEPDAGSDLPALRTRAVRDGDAYRVTGQKTWSTAAEIADRFFTLVRTGPPGGTKDGITYLVVDARLPGVTVRPIRDMTGDAEFCEIFFDDVHVPVTERIGPEHGGWSIARTSIGHERAAGAVNAARRHRRVVAEVVRLARERGVLGDPIVRDRLARADASVRMLEANAQRMLAHIVEYADPGPLSSVSRLASALVEQQVHELAFDVLGPDTLGGVDGEPNGRWVWGYLRTRASTIGAGTAEIQRNTIAERLLGLPTG
jgi:alkylation response protein AidB-like acyl-CoA dehydrogenase